MVAGSFQPARGSCGWVCSSLPQRLGVYDHSLRASPPAGLSVAPTPPKLLQLGFNQNAGFLH